MIRHFHDTILGDLPHGWTVHKLRDLLAADYPGDWGDDTGEVEVTCIRGTNFTAEGQLDLTKLARRFLPRKQAAIMQPKQGDIFLEKSGGGPDQPVARVAFVNRDLPNYAFSNFVHLLRPDPATVTPAYLGRLLAAVYLSGVVVRMEQQTTGIGNLNLRDYLDVLLPLPPPDEQAAIARILDAADTAIERARVAVEKANGLKAGLMQRLLPNWMGFKPANAVKIPAGFKIFRLSEVAKVQNGSTPSRLQPAYWRAGTVPWLATGKVNERIILAASEHVTEKALRECSIELIPEGSVLVGMIGQGKTRGMVAYLTFPSCINQNFGALIPGPALDGKYLFYYLERHYSQLRDIGGGTNQGAMNCYQLRRIGIPLPPPTTQAEIVRILESVDGIIESQRHRVSALERLKRGLMQDLLTGRVRVKAAESLIAATA